MYEQFGASGHQGHTVFKLFVPDRDIDPVYSGSGGSPRIASVHALGDHQTTLNEQAWVPSDTTLMHEVTHPNGRLYQLDLGDQLPDGFYQYKYRVTFQNGTTRWVSDPCAKYGGIDNENAGFVVYRYAQSSATPLAPEKRKPLTDLTLYELMIDDFTEKYRKKLSPVQAVTERLDHITSLGVNAIEFMPWTAWQSNEFSWGYNPYLFFAAEYRYINDPATPTHKLRLLKEMIGACHQMGLHVILDVVFNHIDVSTNSPGAGFPYYWLYENPEDCPFIGRFADAGFFSDLNYNNPATHQFVLDACKYWIDVFKIDGLRLDYTLGLHQIGVDEGLPKLVRDINDYTQSAYEGKFTTIIEHLSDPRDAAVAVAEGVGANGNWHDPLYYQVSNAISNDRPTGELMRRLQTKRFHQNTVPVTYIENHDHTRIADQAGKFWQAHRTQPYAIAWLMSPGAPMLYNGQEWGEDYFVPNSGDDRTSSRPLLWDKTELSVGRDLLNLYRRLIQIRNDYPALRSPHIYPSSTWESWQTEMNPEGYGVDSDRGLMIFHRWGWHEGHLDRFIIAVNTRSYAQQADIPMPHNGRWRDLLNGFDMDVTDYWLKWFVIGPNWGHVFHIRG